MPAVPLRALGKVYAEPVLAIVSPLPGVLSAAGVAVHAEAGLARARPLAAVHAPICMLHRAGRSRPAARRLQVRRAKHCAAGPGLEDGQSVLHRPHKHREGAMHGLLCVLDQYAGLHHWRRAFGGRAAGGRTCSYIGHVPDERGAQTGRSQRRLHERQAQRAQRQTHRAACGGTAGVGEWLTWQHWLRSALRPLHFSPPKDTFTVENRDDRLLRASYAGGLQPSDTLHSYLVCSSKL